MESNLRLMRYSDVLLRAAECENEVNGPTQQAIDWLHLGLIGNEFKTARLHLMKNMPVMRPSRKVVPNRMKPKPPFKPQRPGLNPGLSVLGGES